MNINEQVIYLQKKYRTTDPFEIADAMGTIVLFEELGNINGYYNKSLRIKQIHINWNLDHHWRRFTCAHELAHSIRHPNANTPFLRKHTMLSVDRLEVEANTFAMHLLISDEDLAKCYYDTLGQISRYFGYAEELMALRLQKIEKNLS